MTFFAVGQGVIPRYQSLLKMSFWWIRNFFRTFKWEDTVFGCFRGVLLFTILHNRRQSYSIAAIASYRTLSQTIAGCRRQSHTIAECRITRWFRRTLLQIMERSHRQSHAVTDNRRLSHTIPNWRITRDIGASCHDNQIVLHIIAVWPPTTMTFKLGSRWILIWLFFV